jgi:Helix-turn-helix domain of resolvase
MDLSTVPANTRAGLIAMNAGKPLAEGDGPNAILERYENGEGIEAIALDLGITPPAVYRYLARHAQEDWKEYQAANALHEYQLAEDQLRTASDGVSLTRARELVKSQQWKLERVLRRIYGQDAPAIQVNVNLGDVGQKIRDLEAELMLSGNTGTRASPTTDTHTQVIDV